MCRHSVGIFALVLGLLPAVSTAAEPIAETPTLNQAVRSGWLRFAIVSGRLIIKGSQVGNISSNPSGGNERLSIRSVGGKASLNYELSTAGQQLSIVVGAGNQAVIRRTPKGDSTLVPVRFEQSPGKPASLTLGAAGRQQTYRAASLWHLMIARPEECRRHLAPLLELLGPAWKLCSVAELAEAELLRLAAVGGMPNRSRWAALVEQLADDRFAKREAADRQLRAAGPAVLSYLQGLDSGRLDAEQQFRIRRIIVSMSGQVTDDDARQIASRLVGDRAVWLSLLSRPQQSTRRLAARQLSALLGEPISFDPAAEPAVRNKQIEKLRSRILGGAPEGGD